MMNKVNQKRRLGIRGPLALALGGTFVVFPILSFALLLYDGRLSFPYQNTATGMLLYVSVLVFFGLLISGMGFQMILEDSK